MSSRMAEKAPRQRIVEAARSLFDAKGFHSTPVADLAKAAEVSVGQIYRHFPSKDDIITAIVAEDVQSRLDEMNVIFGEVEAGRINVLDAIRALARIAIVNNNTGLLYEILAECYRNPRVAEKVDTLVLPYRNGIGRLTALVRPDLDDAEQEGYTDVIMACFFGLGHRTLTSHQQDIDQASELTAQLIMRALRCPAG